jgi:hypothetical protein
VAIFGMRFRCAASVGGGSLPAVYYFTPRIIGLNGRNTHCRSLSEKSLNRAWQTNLFEARAYISYNLKFVY